MEKNIWCSLQVRVAGQHFFLYDNAAVMIGLYIVTVIGIGVLALFLYRWQKVPQEQRFQAAMLLALPGMLLDVTAVEFFDTIFPNMDVLADASFGAWLLWAYAIALLTAFVPAR